MDKESKIRKAWGSVPVGGLKDGRVYRVPVPNDPWCKAEGTNAPEMEAWYVEFRREIGTLQGRPAARFIGELGGTEVIVAEGFTD